MGNLSPKTIGGAGVGATAGGGILSAFGALSSGIANKETFDYQASIARLNQQLDKQNADWARETGEQTAGQFGLKAGQEMGHIKTGQAASGLDIRSGSAAEVRSSQSKLNQLDLDVIRSNAAKTAYNFEVQGTMAGAQAGLYDKAGENSLTAGAIGMGSSFLGTAASVSSEWLQGQRVGLWGSNT